MSDNDLLDAVDALTKERVIHTTIIDDETGEWLKVHSETHPPLLTLLLNGTGFSRGPKSAETPIPIDADALELWGQVRDLTRLWCKQLRVEFEDDLLADVRNWYQAHVNAVVRGKVGEGTDLDVTRMVQGWVRMIEAKFEPVRKREWTDHCVGDIEFRNDAGGTESRKCGARRVMLAGSESFAIELNVTTRTATCRECGAVWSGEDALAELRFLTNIDQLMRAGDEVDVATLALATRRKR
jgi:hypothetical protein